MKKLILVVVILAGGISSFAFPTNRLSNETTTVVKIESFTEISLDELPDAIKTAVQNDFASATLSKAYVNESEQYKLILVNEDGSESTVYADKDGNWIDEEAIVSEE